MAEPAIRDLPRLPRIDPAWRLPTEAELPYEDDERLAESDYQLEPLGYAFYGLRGHYAGRTDVAVHADMFVHYLRVDEHGEVRLDEDGRPIVDRLAPDVFVIFGVPNRKRDSYVTYDEGKPPDFVLEVLSGSTWRRDMGAKKTIYERMGVQEYWILDPVDAYIDPPPLRGFRRIGDHYEPIDPMPGAGIAYASEVLGLELRLADGVLRIRDPVAGEDLRGPIELKEALEAETTARGREEVLRREIEEAYRREKAAQNEGDFARRLAEAKQLEAEAALLRKETALHQAESARDEAEAGRLEAEARRREAEAGRSDERRARVAAEAAAEQAAARIAELEARLRRQTGDR